MSTGPSPGPTWTTLREPTDASSVVSPGDVDGDDELEVEKELTDPPLQKRKAQYSPSNELRANKFRRLGLTEPSKTSRWAQGVESSDGEETGGPSGTRPSVNEQCTLSTHAIDKATSTKSTFVGSSSSDEFGGTLTQFVRQANTKERLAVQKKDKDIGVQRDSRRGMPAPTNRVVARKKVNGRPRISTGLLLQGVQTSNDPDSPACTRVRPKKKALVVNRNALLAHFRPLDTERQRSNPEVIELTDSDGGHGPHSTGAVLENSTTMSKGSRDLIIISSGSEGNCPRSPVRVRRRSAPIFRSTKKAPSTVPRRASDFITILDGDDDNPVATSSVTQEHRPSTTTALSASTTVEAQPEGCSELQSISVSELGSLANADPDGTCSLPTSPRRPDIDDTLDRAFGDIDLDPGNVGDHMADTDLDVDRRHSAAGACEERRGVMGVQVNADVAVEEHGGNKDAREDLQDFPGSKTIALSCINSSSKSSELSSNTTGGRMPYTTFAPPRKVPSISKEFVLPDVSSYSVRFNRPENSQSSFFSRAFGPSTSIQTASTPLISKSIIEMIAPDDGTSVKEHPGAEDSSQTSTSAPAALLSVGLASLEDCEHPQAEHTLPSRPSGSENSTLPSWKRDSSPSVQPSVALLPVWSRKSPSRSTSATPAVQSHSTTPYSPIPPPCRPPPLSSASLVDTLNQIRRDHLQAKVARQKSKEPVPQAEKKLEQTTSQPLASDGVEPPLTPSQSKASRESRPRQQSPRIPGEPPSLTPLRSSFHDKRLRKPESKLSPSEAIAHHASRPGSEPSSSIRSAAMEPSLHAPADVPSLAITTTATSASIATPRRPTSPALPRRVPVSFQEFISKLPGTQRSPLARMRSDGPPPSQSSPRRSISVSFEEFIVKTQHGRNASMWQPSQFDDVTSEATKESQSPQRDGSQNNCDVDDETSVEVRTDHLHAGFNADQLLELADADSESGEPETYPPPEGYPRPLAESGIHATDVEMAVVAESYHIGQILPAGGPDSVVASRDSLVPNHRTPVMTPGSDDTSIAPVDARLNETMSEDNHFLAGSRSGPPPETLSGRSPRRRSSRHHSLSRSLSSTEPPPMDIVSTADAIKQPGQPSALGDSEYIGGYPVITWQSFTASQRLLPPTYNRARDLPHSLQDHMNAFPESYRNSKFSRTIFEQMILEAMDDEPDAPPIKVYDNGIGEEVTPPWEFVYTNKIWFGEGVPPPDVRNLVSCGCQGKCDPNSKTCACAKRQLQWLEPYIRDGLFPATWPGSPFVYDSRGILQREGCPIFECNQFCDCDDDCPNRVVQNGRIWPVNIVRTERKGWGVFAGRKKIPRGSYIGIYAGELLTEQEGEARGLLYNVFGRTYLFSIDFHHLKLGLTDENDYENLYTVDAYHAGNFTRFLNHSCDPNCEITACYINDADINKPLLAVFTVRDVEPWEELCFSYYGDTEAKRESLMDQQADGRLIARHDAVYVECSCGSANCIGKLF